MARVRVLVALIAAVAGSTAGLAAEAPFRLSAVGANDTTANRQ